MTNDEFKNFLGSAVTLTPKPVFTMPASYELPPRIKREEVREARGWLFDCFGDDDDAFAIIDVASAITIFLLIQKHYEGGWAAFVAAGE